VFKERTRAVENAVAARRQWLYKENEMNRFFGGNKDADEDKADDPKVIESELRDGIEKELQKPDLSAEDRKSYEDALAKLNSEDAGQGG
jgi:hypothetical protein